MSASKQAKIPRTGLGSRFLSKKVKITIILLLLVVQSRAYKYQCDNEDLPVPNNVMKHMFWFLAIVVTVYFVLEKGTRQRALVLYAIFSGIEKIATMSDVLSFAKEPALAFAQEYKTQIVGESYNEMKAKMHLYKEKCKKLERELDSLAEERHKRKNQHLMALEDKDLVVTAANNVRIELVAATNQERMELVAATNHERMELVAAANQERIELVAAANQERIESVAATNQERIELVAAANQERIESVAAANNERIQLTKRCDAAVAAASEWAENYPAAKDEQTKLYLELIAIKEEHDAKVKDLKERFNKTSLIHRAGSSRFKHGAKEVTDGSSADPSSVEKR